MFRFKDLEAWWSNQHFDRPGGLEQGTPTGWAPKSKPIWLTELGCPAVDKGANQPNVFYDPKSASSALPYFSTGIRDDLAQRSYIDAYQAAFDPGHPAYSGGNPVSPSYGGRMVDPGHLHLWAWDARPYPFFPALTDMWSDGENWERGHWLNGRLGAVTLESLIAAVLNDHGFSRYDIRDAHGLVEGYVVTELISARAPLEPVLQVVRIDAADAGDRILFRGRSRPADAALTEPGIAERPERPLISRTRAQETELTSELVLRAIHPGSDYRTMAASSRRLAGQSRRVTTIELPAVLDFGEAKRLTDALLRDIWTGREQLEFALPPSLSPLDPGDIVTLASGAVADTVSIERAEDGLERRVHARRVGNRLRPAVTRRPRPDAKTRAPHFGQPAVRLIEFAPPDGVAAHAPRLAVFAEPWPGTVAVYRAAEGGGFRLATRMTGRATMGKLDAPLAPGPSGAFDRANQIFVTLFGGALASRPDIDILGGANAAGIRMTNGSWEVLQFAEAELIGSDMYRLSRLLRGQCGTEAAMLSGAASGADFVLIDQAVTAFPAQTADIGVPIRCRIGPARDTHSAASFTELTITPKGTGLRPFAPVHLRARREAATGDVVFTWIRRTRFGGDSWDLADAPLNEQSEAYRLEIFSGEVLRRRATTASPQYRYSAAEQSEDSGGPASAVAVRVAQLSATAGPGYWLQESINV